MNLTTNNKPFRIKDPSIPGFPKLRPSKIDGLLKRIQDKSINPGHVLQSFIENFLEFAMYIHFKRLNKQRLTPRDKAQIDFIERIIIHCEELSKVRQEDEDRKQGEIPDSCSQDKAQSG